MKIFSALLFFTVSYPYIRFSSERDRNEIERFEAGLVRCRGEFKSEHFSYILEADVYNDFPDFDPGKFWEQMKGLPAHLRIAGTISMLGESGYTKWLFFDSWHLVSVHQSTNLGCGGRKENTGADRLFFIKGEIIKFY